VGSRLPFSVVSFHIFLKILECEGGQSFQSVFPADQTFAAAARRVGVSIQLVICAGNYESE